MLQVKIGGVAEHYNLPWHLLNESGELAGIDVEMQWCDCPGGTGEMTKLLATGQLDLAVLLTEGMVADKLKGSKTRILKVFVKSSLEWGVHVAEDSVRIDEKDELTFAVSRLGSGSHHMAQQYAHHQEIPASKIRFREVGSLEGAIKAFNSGETDVFLWERFTTEPYCKAHKLKRIDSIHTPWPCFVIAARPDFYQSHQQQIDEVFKLVFSYADKLKNDPSAVDMISHRYDLPGERVAKWFEKVEWGSGENLSDIEIETVVNNLKHSGDLVSEIEVFENNNRLHTMLLSV